MFKRQKIFATKNFQSGAAGAHLEFLCDLPVLHLARRSFSEGGSSKSRFDKPIRQAQGPEQVVGRRRSVWDLEFLSRV
jgi:hypothetical protein